MHTINMSQLAIVYMTTDINRELIDEQPPQAPYEADTPQAQQEMTDNLKRTAYMYDAYKDVVDISVYWNRKFHHFMLCDDMAVQANKRDDEIRYMEIFEYEQDMMTAFHSLVCQICPETIDGIPLGGGILAGWKLTSDIWPILVNKVFKHGLHMPACLLTDPMKRWSSVDRLLDVSNIYSQGVSMNMRRLPALADTLEYWGCVGDHACPDRIRTLICEQPVLAAAQIETYLMDMDAVIRQYYRIRLGE